MSALTDATPTRAPSPGRPCSVAAALDTLDPESAADLQGWLEGRLHADWTDVDVFLRLQALGHRVGKQTVGRHKRMVRGTGDPCGCVA